MKKDPILENLWLFERFTSGEMDEEEERTFKNRLNDEEVFREAFEEYKRLYDAIGDKEALDLRRKLKRIEEQYRRKHEKKGGIINLGLWYWLAATLVIVGGLSVLLLVILRPAQDMALQYADYKEVDSLVLQGEEFSLPDNYYMLKQMIIRSPSFRFRGPRDSSVFIAGEMIEIKWKAQKEEQIGLRLFDRDGNLILHNDNPEGNSVVLSTELKPGVYVYELTVNERMGHVGIFFVVNSHL